jgi:hypothetical protein
MLNEMITAVRKGGRISIVGVYSGFVNHLNIGECWKLPMVLPRPQPSQLAVVFSAPAKRFVVYWHYYIAPYDTTTIGNVCALT